MPLIKHAAIAAIISKTLEKGTVATNHQSLWLLIPVRLLYIRTTPLAASVQSDREKKTALFRRAGLRARRNSVGTEADPTLLMFHKSPAAVSIRIHQYHRNHGQCQYLNCESSATVFCPVLMHSDGLCTGQPEFN